MNRLREIRNAKNLTQMQLAGRSGVCQWTISRIEHHKRMPGLPIAHRLAKALDVSMEEIFFPKDGATQPETLE